MAELMEPGKSGVVIREERGFAQGSCSVCGWVGVKRLKRSRHDERAVSRAEADAFWHSDGCVVEAPPADAAALAEGAGR